jgi:hypothetical protein
MPMRTVSRRPLIVGFRPDPYDYAVDMAPSSFEYIKPLHNEDVVCPHCKQAIKPGDNVHWYDSVLWHTKPCP